MDVSKRAGIDYLGKYRSSRPEWKRALTYLGRQVVKPAVDYDNYWRLRPYHTELDPERDNRSVTNSEWVQEALERYGCPIHEASVLTRSGNQFNYRIPGRGPCSCRRDTGQRVGDRIDTVQKRGRDINRTHRNGGAFRPHRAGSNADSVDSGDWRASLSARGTHHRKGDGSRVFQSEAYRYAVSQALRLAGSRERRRKPYSVDTVVENHIDHTAYAGAPYFSRNELVLDAASQAAKRIMAGRRGFEPYTAGRRVQPGPPKPKTRLIWMASLPTTIVGTCFSKPVSEALARRRPFSWGLRDIEKAAFVEELKSRFRYIYSLDYSGFDSSVPARMIDDAFGVARTHLDLTDEEGEVWNRYVSDFIHSRLITPDGDVYRVHKGVPSGSAFTSIIDSIVNLILTNYIWHRLMGHGIASDRLFILGDDVVFASDARYDLADISRVAGELGFTVSVQKSEITDTHRDAPDPYTNQVHFLGHYWVKGYPRRPRHELLQRIAYPERHAHRSKQQSLVRFYSYLQDSREAHEIFGKVYPFGDILKRLTVCLDDIGDMDDELVFYDLPGQLRYKVKVEGAEVPEIRSQKGLTLGLFGLAT